MVSCLLRYLNMGLKLVLSADTQVRGGASGGILNFPHVKLFPKSF